MASRLTVLRERITSAILAAFEIFGAEATPVVAERTAPFLQEGEGPIDFHLFQQLLARMIGTSVQQMVAADKAHVDELANDVVPRSRRDAVVSAVRRKLIEIRGLARSLFGTERAGEIVAVDGSTAVEPELLWRQAEHTLSRLEDPELVLPPMSSGAVTFDPAVYAAELSPEVSALKQLIGEIERDRKVKATSLKAKQEAMEEHDLLIGACGRILTGLCLLARRQDLAKRIRIRFPSRVGTAETPSDEAPSEGTSGEGPPGGPAPAAPETAGSQPATA